MTRESLARKFKPAGFEQPEGSRQNYTKPRDELKDAFYKWLGELPEYFDWERYYTKAQEMVRPLGEIHYMEANFLLLNFEPKRNEERKAGLFISACYSQSHDQIIIFDFDAPEIELIGYRLGKGKVLVNNGTVSDLFGAHSECLVVNNDDTEDQLGAGSNGVVINNGRAEMEIGQFSSGTVIGFGKAGRGFGSWARGLLIAVKEPYEYGHRPRYRMSLEPEDLEKMPELKIYLEALSEVTKSIKDEESAKRFLERYGPEPKEKIEKDIREFL